MPSISAITPATFDSGRSVTLSGSGFGASTGSVLIGGVAQNVNTWSDTSITFGAVRGAQSLGACRVDVVGGGGTSYTPTVIVTNQAELNTELAKSAAALEGQVIGVQYNATPYRLLRSNGKLWSLRAKHHASKRNSHGICWSRSRNQQHLYP